MHKFYIICNCIKANNVYGIKLGDTYSGEGHINNDGSVNYLIRIPGSPYGPQLYKSEWFGNYFRITHARVF